MKKVYYSLMSYLPSPRAKHIINNNYLIQTVLKAIYNNIVNHLDSLLMPLIV